MTDDALGGKSAQPYYHAGYYSRPRIFRKGDPFDGLDPRQVERAAQAHEVLAAGAWTHRRGSSLPPGPLIRALRRGAGITQAGLAGMAGLRQAAVCDLETGRRDPRWSELVRLLDALGCAPLLGARDAGGYPLRAVDDE